MGRKSRLFVYLISYPDSQFAHLDLEIVESLRSCAPMFPFCGDLSAETHDCRPMKAVDFANWKGFEQILTSLPPRYQG
jgi:hypothetical protein